MQVVIRRLLREHRGRFAIVGFATTLWLLVLLLVVRNSAPMVAAKADAFGGAITKGFGLGALVTPDAVIAQIVGLGFNHPFMLVLAGALTVSFGTRACQGELADGTLDLTLARSISRTRFLLAYVVVVVGAVLVLMTIAGASTLLWDRVFSVPGTLEVGRVVSMCLHGAVVYLAFGALSLLVSVLAPRHMSAGFISVGILIVMYATSFVERIWTGVVMDVIGPMSLFHWFDPGGILGGASLELRDVFVPLVEAIAFTLLAMWRFERRDL